MYLALKEQHFARMILNETIDSNIIKPKLSLKFGYYNKGLDPTLLGGKFNLQDG